MNLSEKDIEALRIKDKVMYCRAEILDTDYKTVEMIEGNIVTGNYSINCDSDIRRSCNLTMCLNNDDFKLTEDLFFNHYVKIYIGYYSYITDEILYYSIGIYSFDKQSVKYDVTSNEISFTLLDLCSLMDANHYGTEYGAETAIIYAVNPETGERYSKTDKNMVTLRNIVNGLLDDFEKTNTFKGGKPKINFKNRRIDPIGRDTKSDEGYEYAWDELPYDLEFSFDSGLIDKLKQIKELYGIHEFFFDVDGTFIFQQIPVTDEDMIMLSNDVTQDLVISENTDINIFDVKNVVEVWGKTVELTKEYRGVEALSTNTTSNSITYNVTLKNYAESDYSSDIKLALKVNDDNSRKETYIKINSLENKKVYDKTTGEPLAQNKLKAGNTYIVEYSPTAGGVGGFYYLSSYQVHAVAIMTTGEMAEGSYSTKAERLQFFAKKYNTDNITFIEDRNCNYCIEYIGEVRKRYGGNNFANLDTDSIAANYAVAKLTQLCRRSTSLSLTMVVVPWLDVNQKIEYKPINSETPKVYITKSISGDLLSGTMTVNLMDFYATLDTEN